MTPERLEQLEAEDAKFKAKNPNLYVALKAAHDRGLTRGQAKSDPAVIEAAHKDGFVITSIILLVMAINALWELWDHFHNP